MLNSIINLDSIIFLEKLINSSVQPDLIYVDPPFGVGRNFKGKSKTENPDILEFSDKWENIEPYLVWVEELIASIHNCLSKNGSLLFHCDYHASHHIACLLDKHFGTGARVNNKDKGFRNELVWSYGLGGSSKNSWSKKHDNIFWYTKSENWYFSPHMVPATSNKLSGQLKKSTDVLSIPNINNMSKERTGYPTQKPIELLEILINSHCPSGGIVVDPCCGSGTTLVAAKKTNRNYIGSDKNIEAVKIANERIFLLK